jgi:hypothetical protein
MFYEMSGTKTGEHDLNNKGVNNKGVDIVHILDTISGYGILTFFVEAKDKEKVGQGASEP